MASDIEPTLDLTELNEERWTRIDPAFAVELVDRVFTSGLHLAALHCLLGPHEASGKLEMAIGELDQIIRDIRAGAIPRPASPVCLPGPASIRPNS